MVKKCDWCGKEIKHRQNYKPHVDKCIYRTEIGMKKDDIFALRGMPVPEQAKSEETKMFEIFYMELKQYLSDNYSKSLILHKKIIENESKSPLEKIKEMLVSDSTKKGYIIEWNLYNKWLKKNNKMISKETANEYISKLKSKPSTRKKKQGMLQILFKHLLDNSITLNKTRERVTYKSKYAMTDEDIQKYMSEQQGINSENYLMQRLMLTFGLRVNSIALLRIKHLEFFVNNNKKIHLPDSKVKRERVEEIDDQLQDLIIKHIENTRPEFDENTFVFYKEGDRLDEKLRAHKICVLINCCIQDSKVLEKNSNYKYSSHMFRKTVAFNIYNQKLNELKAEARRAILN
jgi:integrase